MAGDRIAAACAGGALRRWGERFDQLLLEPREIAVDRQVSPAGSLEVERLEVDLLAHVEARAQHEPQVVQGSQPPSACSGSSARYRASRARRDGRRTAVDELVADERPVLLLGAWDRRWAGGKSRRKAGSAGSASWASSSSRSSRRSARSCAWKRGARAIAGCARSAAEVTPSPAASSPRARARAGGNIELGLLAVAARDDRLALVVHLEHELRRLLRGCTRRASGRRASRTT